MVECLAKDGAGENVSKVMDRDIPTVSPDTNLAEVLRPLRNRKYPAVGITDHMGKLIGYVTLENVGELLMVETALGKS